MLTRVVVVLVAMVVRCLKTVITLLMVMVVAVVSIESLITRVGMQDMTKLMTMMLLRFAMKILLGVVMDYNGGSNSSGDGVIFLVDAAVDGLLSYGGVET